MLQGIQKLFFKLKLVTISKKNIEKWKRTKQVLKLEYALQYGNYLTRQLAAEALGQVGEKSSIPLLFNATEDSIKNVSIAALNALETIGFEDEFAYIIIKKRFNWLKKKREKDAKMEANKNNPKKHNIYKWKRASKKSFDRVKEQLKKPMR